MDRQTAKQKIKDAIIAAIQKAGHRGFQDSQRNVPVETGRLKRSGSEKSREDGVEITYEAPYASFVHDGTQAGERHVKAHTRESRPVKAYIYHAPATKANPFLEKALTESFDKFADDIDENLKSSMSNVKITKEGS